MNLAANILLVDDVNRLWTIEPPKLFRAELDRALLWAFDRGASDIVLMTDEPVMIRLDGEWQRVSSRRLSGPEILELLSDIYAPNAAALLSGGEPLDFSHRVIRSREAEVRFRVNATAGQTAFSGMAGIGVVFRSIPSVPPTVKELELEAAIIQAHEDVSRSQGLFLVIGATGTGKTTLIASLMRHSIETPPGRMLLTYEAPIEFNLSAVPNKCGVVIQTEIPRHQATFRQGVANALRRAPDIILIGEARDPETIDGVVVAAQTGHAVYTTLHANSVAAALPRLIGEFPPAQQRSILARVLDVLRFAVTQRLVPKVAGGRIALREFLVFDADIRRQLANADPDRLQPIVHELVRRRGQSLLADARQKHAQGLISEDTLALISAEWNSVEVSA